MSDETKKFEDHVEVDDIDEMAEPASVDDALPGGGGAPIAYIRPLTQEELSQAPAEIRGPSTVALLDENGRPLALFRDRATAIVAAQANDFKTMSVH